MKKSTNMRDMPPESPHDFSFYVHDSDTSNHKACIPERIDGKSIHGSKPVIFNLKQGGHHGYRKIKH